MDVDYGEVDVFHFEENNLNFNDLATENGFTHWYARDFMQMLGYASYDSFKKAINKAISTCMTLDIDVTDNFQQVTSVVDGSECADYKLSRFACYLVVMNGDGKKIGVARGQAFFAATAETIRRYVDSTDDVDRVLIREEVCAHEKSLSGVAKKAGVEGQGYALFQNAGYRGMYNMNLSQLKKQKRMTKSNRSLLDFMGKEELAANLFRITQTEAKLRNEDIRGQQMAENAAESVGRKVRKTMIEISGNTPEHLPLSEDIKKVKTSLKQTQKGLKKLDS